MACGLSRCTTPRVRLDPQTLRMILLCHTSKLYMPSACAI